MALTPRDESLALRCPRCGYNLTGTAGDTCPECGAGFDRVVLAMLAQVEPITSREIAWCVLWPAIVSFGVGLMPFVSFLVLPLVWLIILIGCGAQAKRTARRVAYSRAMNDPQGRYRVDDRRCTLVAAVGLLVAQMTLAVAAGLSGIALTMGLLFWLSQLR